MNAKVSSTSQLNDAISPPPWIGLGVLLLAGFVTIFDLFVVNIAIPSIQRDLHVNMAQIGFIIAGYELAFGTFLITGGRLGDIFGRRRLFIVGMAGFTLASVLCGQAQGAAFIIGARVLQGMAAALLFPQVYASIRATFSAVRARRAFALLGMTLGLAAIAGQVLGGWLVSADLFSLGWRNIFFVNIPVGLFAIFTARYIPESRMPEHTELDWAGVMLISTGLALLLVSIIEGPLRGWPAWCWWSLGSAALLLTLFYRQQEYRRKAGGIPMVDMQLLTQRRFTLSAILVLLIYSTSSSFFLCFALLAQNGLDLDPFTAGSIFAPCSIGFILASLASPRMTARWGTMAIAFGAHIYALSTALLIAQVWLTGSTLLPVHLIPILIAVGAGQGLIMTPLLNVVLGFVEREQAGMASGVISTLQQIGAALGVAIVGGLFGSVLREGKTLTLAEQYSSAFVTGMLYNLLSCIVICGLLFVLAKHYGDHN